MECEAVIRTLCEAIARPHGDAVTALLTHILQEASNARQDIASLRQHVADNFEEVSQMSQSLHAVLAQIKSQVGDVNTALDNAKERDGITAAALAAATDKIAALTAQLEAAPEDNTETQTALADIAAGLTMAKSKADAIEVPASAPITVPDVPAATDPAAPATLPSGAPVSTAPAFPDAPVNPDAPLSPEAPIVTLG